MERHARELLPAHHEAIDEVIETAEAAASRRTAWRIEGTLREFPRFSPHSVWFDYPVHREDESGALSDLHSEGSRGANLSKSAKRVPAEQRRASIASAYEALKLSPPVTVQAMAEYLNVSVRTVKRRIETDESGAFWVRGGIVGCENLPTERGLS